MRTLACGVRLNCPYFRTPANGLPVFYRWAESQREEATTLFQRPKLLAYTNQKPPVPVLAAAYAWGLIRDHPFIDGNKRTAFLVATAFCEANGYKFQAPEGEPAIIFQAATAGEIQEPGLTAWFRRHTKRAK